MRFEDRKKFIPSDKLEIEGVERTILSWLNINPVLLQSFFNQHRGWATLSKHLELELKKRLTNEPKRKNTRGSSNRSNKTP